MKLLFFRSMALALGLALVAHSSLALPGRPRIIRSPDTMVIRGCQAVVPAMVAARWRSPLEKTLAVFLVTMAGAVTLEASVLRSTEGVGWQGLLDGIDFQEYGTRLVISAVALGCAVAAHMQLKKIERSTTIGFLMQIVLSSLFINLGIFLMEHFLGYSRMEAFAAGFFSALTPFLTPLSRYQRYSWIVISPPLVLFIVFMSLFPVETFDLLGVALKSSQWMAFPALSLIAFVIKQRMTPPRPRPLSHLWDSAPAPMPAEAPKKPSPVMTAEDRLRSHPAIKVISGLLPQNRSIIEKALKGRQALKLTDDNELLVHDVLAFMVKHFPDVRFEQIILEGMKPINQVALWANRQRVLLQRQSGNIWTIILDTDHTDNAVIFSKHEVKIDELFPAELNDRIRGRRPDQSPNVPDSPSGPWGDPPNRSPIRNTSESDEGEGSPGVPVRRSFAPGFGFARSLAAA